MGTNRAELIESRVEAGVWRALVRSEDQPALAVTSEGQALAGLAVGAIEGRAAQWLVTVPIPAGMITDGVRILLLREGERVLGHLTLSAGPAEAEGLAAEVDLLRAELELLKEAFRRHCRET
jgi:hypothetical protein